MTAILKLNSGKTMKFGKTADLRTPYDRNIALNPKLTAVFVGNVCYPP